MYQEATVLILMGFIGVLSFGYKNFSVKSNNWIITEIVNCIRVIFMGLSFTLLPLLIGVGILMLKSNNASSGLVRLFERAYTISNYLMYILLVILALTVILSFVFSYTEEKKRENIKRYGRA